MRQRPLKDSSSSASKIRETPQIATDDDDDALCFDVK